MSINQSFNQSINLFTWYDWCFDLLPNLPNSNIH